MLIVVALRAGDVTPPFRVARPLTENVFVASAGPLNCALPPLTKRPDCAVTWPNTVKVLVIWVAPLFTFRPALRFVVPLATVRPALTVAPAFKKAPPVVVKVLLTDVGLAKTTCVGDIVFPPQLNVPLPLCVRLPSTFTVERKMLDGIVKLLPPPPGTGTH